MYRPRILSQTLWWHDQASDQQHARSYLQRLPIFTLTPGSTLLDWQASTFLVCPLIYWSTHIAQLGRNKRKFCGSLYRYLSNHCSFVNHRFVFSCTWIRGSFYPTSIQFISLLDSSDVTPHISLCRSQSRQQNHFWLNGSWPRFKVKFSKQISTLLALSIAIRGARAEVSPKAVGGLLEPIFCT